MKTYSKTVTLLFFILLITVFNFSCQNKKEVKTIQLKEKVKNKKHSVSTNKDSVSNELTAHQKQFIESFRKTEKTVSVTDFETIDNQNNTYLTKISKLTDLNHKQVCQISAKFGLYELEKIINAMPADSANTKEAKRLTLLMRFNRISISEECKNYLMSKKNSSLSKKDQLQNYLAVYEESAKFHTDINEKIDLNKKTYQKSEKLAILTGISFEKLAIIESQLGLLGLRSAIMNIPDFPKKEEALEILSK